MTWSIGFTAESFTRLGATRQLPDWSTHAAPFGPAYHFFADEFTREVTLGDEVFYKISVALAENIYALTWTRDEAAVADDVQYAGIHFPSIAMRASSDKISIPRQSRGFYYWSASKALVNRDPPKGGYSPNFI